MHRQLRAIGNSLCPKKDVYKAEGSALGLIKKQKLQDFKATPWDAPSGLKHRFETQPSATRWPARCVALGWYGIAFQAKKQQLLSWAFYRVCGEVQTFETKPSGMRAPSDEETIDESASKTGRYFCAGPRQVDEWGSNAVAGLIPASLCLRAHKRG